MASMFKAHRIAAVIVFVAAAAWIVTGEFSAVGSEEARAAENAPEPAGESAAPLRTVAAVTPVFIDHAREIRVFGLTDADKRATLAARASGIAAGIGIAEGGTVTADQIVLTLEGPDVTADVVNAEATLSKASRELAVAEELFARGNYPELQLEGTRAEKASAEARLKQAQAAADRLNLRAPFGGIVEDVVVEAGEWVEQGTPIATILSLDPIVVKAEVSEIDIAQIALGARAVVNLVSGATMEGTVRQIANVASPATRTFGIEIGLPNPDRSIPAGMTASVTLFARPERAVVIPRSAITLSDEGEIGVRVVTQDDTAAFAAVRIVDDTPDGLIVAGLAEDVRIVTSGQDLVRDGDKVIVVDGAALQKAESGAAAPSP